MNGHSEVQQMLSYGNHIESDADKRLLERAGGESESGEGRPERAGGRRAGQTGVNLLFRAAPGY